MFGLGAGELVIVMILFGVAALTTSRLSRGVSSLRPRRTLDDRALLAGARATPLTAIGQVRDGDWVRIMAAVDGPSSDPELRAPLSGLYCVAYHSAVEYSPTPAAAVADASSSLAEERRAVESVVDDGTGRARIVVSGARIVLTLRSIEPPVARVDAWLARRGVERALGASSREAVLASVALVTVTGRARWEDEPDLEPRDPDATYRSSVRPRRLVLESTPLRTMLVTDAESVTPRADGVLGDPGAPTHSGSAGDANASARR